MTDKPRLHLVSENHATKPRRARPEWLQFDEVFPLLIVIGPVVALVGYLLWKWVGD
jgi:hypothetical protein